MKTLKPILLVVLGLLLITTSCRTEDDLNIDPPAETTLIANSALANSIQRVAMNDGSVDNIVYNANCFTIQLPVTLSINSVVITINEIGDYDDIEAILDEFDDDDDIVEIDFPITIILADFTEIEINSLDQLEQYADDCNGEYEEDEDIECIDFIYPITAAIFNSNNEVIATVTFNNDNDLYEFIDDIEEDDLVNFNFPISVVLSDGTELIINDLNDLNEAIDEYSDDCDEDDDYDYNDDDCNNCTSNNLESVLTACTDWYIDDLERNDQDLTDTYTGYLFNFFEDNTITVSWGVNTANGSWSASGSGNNISVIIDIPGFDDINDSWNLHEIENAIEVEVKLEIGDDSELDFKNDTCN